MVERREIGDVCSFQSTLPARGATAIVWRSVSLIVISIHAPREGSDIFDTLVIPYTVISIHAPREGSDMYLSIITHSAADFNPRSPRGERPRRT